MDNKVQQADTLLRRGQKVKGYHAGNLCIVGYTDSEWPCLKSNVNLFISMPPHISVSEVMQKIKGKAPLKKLIEFRRLSRLY